MAGRKWEKVENQFFSRGDSQDVAHVWVIEFGSGLEWKCLICNKTKIGFYLIKISLCEKVDKCSRRRAGFCAFL